MREYVYDHRIGKQRKLKHRFAHKHILRIFTVCSCLIVIGFIGSQIGKNINQWNTINMPGYFSDAGTNESGAVVDKSAWSLILVNKWNYIPDDYEVELTELANGESVDIRIYSALQEMFDSARKDNIYPVVVSGYRTAEKQQNLMDEKINDYLNDGYSPDEAKEKAEAWVAIPGTSEHQLGLAVDINADGIHSTGDQVYDWLEENAHKFGFIWRYSSDKTDITGVINEPWHYRYVGIDAATEIKNQGVCLEEYLGRTNV